MGLIEIVVMVCFIYMSNLNKLYALNRCTSLYVNYASLDFFKKIRGFQKLIYEELFLSFAGRNKI